MAQIKLETGLKTYDIVDEKGNIRGQISFNPTDANLMERASRAGKIIDDCFDDLRNFKDDATEQEIQEKMVEIDNIIKDAINMLFDDDNASQVVFGSQNCLNTLNGVTFVERFITAMMPVIQKEIADEQKKSQKKIQKYTTSVTPKAKAGKK